MIRPLLTVTTALSIAALASSGLIAAPCRDAKGHFTKCPEVKAAPAARCRDAKGKFAKCGTPGATPITKK
jgi:hypothetical protein